MPARMQIFPCRHSRSKIEPCDTAQVRPGFEDETLDIQSLASLHEPSEQPLGGWSRVRRQSGHHISRNLQRIAEVVLID